MVVSYTGDRDIDFLISLVKQAELDLNAILIEIGTAKLGTTIPLAYTVPYFEIITIDTYDSPKVRSKDFDSNLQILEEYGISNVQLVQSTSEEFGIIFEEDIDFLWIDGFHAYEVVKKDIEIWGDKLKSGCFICGHDYSTLQVQDAVTESVENSNKYIDFDVFSNSIWYARKR